MEIHAPDEPVLTLKQAAVHLAIVTAGVLIALTLEGLMESSHQRSLVREASVNLTSELQANQQELERLIGKIEPMRNKLVHAIDVIGAVPAPESVQEAQSLFRAGSNPNFVMIPWDRAELGGASRTTSEITGAFALREYAEVKKYASVYDRQVLCDKLQEEALSSALTAASLGPIVDFQKPSAIEIQDLKRPLRIALGNVLAIEEIGRALHAAYARALDESK